MSKKKPREYFGEMSQSAPIDRIVLGMFFIHTNIRTQVYTRLPHLLNWQECVGDVLISYPLAKESPVERASLHFRYASITYQKIKRLAEKGVPHAQEVVDMLSVLFEYTLPQRIYIN